MGSEIEIVNEMLKLTDEQKKAWDRMVRAHRDFKKLGGEIYQVLNIVHGFNKKYVDKIANTHEIIGDEYFVIGSDCDIEESFNFGTDSFADDRHGVILNFKGMKLLEQKLSSEG